MFNKNDEEEVEKNSDDSNDQDENSGTAGLPEHEQ